jgi:serine phosphatase RsbU (regulator of sigma subunit)
MRLDGRPSFPHLEWRTAFELESKCLTDAWNHEPTHFFEEYSMRLLSRLSVAVSYPIMTLLLVMGVFVLIGFLALRGTKETSSELMLRLTDQATERMRQYVLSTLQAPIRIADFNAQLLSDGSMQIQSSDDLVSHVPFMASQLRTWTGISAILICNKQGEVVWVERSSDDTLTVHEYLNDSEGFCIETALDSEGQRISEELGRYRYVPSERPWYVAAMSSEKSSGWTPLYLWANSQVEGILGSGRSVRVNSVEGEFLGIIDIGFTVNDLSRQLKQIKISPNGRVFIMNSDGMLVAADRVDDASAGTTGILAIDSTDFEIKNAAKSLGGPESFLDERGFRHASFTTSDGEVYQVDSELLKQKDGPQWTLVTILPESDILAGVNVVQERLIYSALVVLLVAGFIAILLARSITAPIVSLKKSASEIASGDLDRRFSSRGGLEFTQLSEALERMTRGLRERLEMRSALEVAMEVQQNLLPQSFPSTKQLDIAGSSVFSDETGGDYFDFPMHSDDAESTEDGSVTIAIGDVTGHGIGAALIMAAARAALRTCLREKVSMGRLLGEVNEVLFGDVPNGRFMTMLMLRMSSDGSHIDWASAGHDPPIIYSPKKDTFTEPFGGGVPLAILPNEFYEQYELALEDGGEIIFTATDGVWETANEDKELFGKERLMDVLRACSKLDSETIIKRVIAALDEFRGSKRPADDVTMVVVRRLS